MHGRKLGTGQGPQKKYSVSGWSFARAQLFLDLFEEQGSARHDQHNVSASSALIHVSRKHGCNVNIMLAQAHLSFEA